MKESMGAYEEYLAALPPDRRSAVEKVWQVVRESMPAGYTEGVGAKLLTFKAGDESYVALANQKNYVSLYLTPLYVFPELKVKLDASGKQLNCGKSCINFLKAEALPLEVIAEIVGSHGPEAYRAHVRRVKSEGYHGKQKSGG
ncbi:MAG: DUF1801 domain-containing protein [Ferruginibacter sp.]|nr:DUF1801 domain-containing protein [Cytophagales bacterium]